MSYRFPVSYRFKGPDFWNVPVATFGGRWPAGARATAAIGALSGLMGVVLVRGARVPPPPGGGGAGRRAPTMLNGGCDTSITISGMRLSDLKTESQGAKCATSSAGTATRSSKTTRHWRWRIRLIDSCAD